MTKPFKPRHKSKKKTAAKKTAAASPKRKRTPRRASDEPFLASPSATGPTGALLEGHVGAQYLLPLLSGGEARGLPGVVVTRVAFQRGGFDHPLDDVVVTGHDHQGRPATLELQAKRTIDFRPSDKNFEDVVALACRAAASPEFLTTRYELAVAISRTSTKIEQHIQDVLKWAREYQSAEAFFRRLNQRGASDKSKLAFIEAFRGHMRTAGSTHEDTDVWQLLSRFQVLAFDFEQPGSVCAQLARERCVLQLVPQDAGRGSELWDSLRQIALEVDAAGGDLDAPALHDRLTGDRGYRLAGDRCLHVARDRLAEAAEFTLANISTQVRGVTIDRANCVADALAALDRGRYLEIRGAGGVGKSGVLKELALRKIIESRIIVVAPNRVPSGGWAALAAQLGCEARAREFLTDLAGDGGGILFVDGIDRFDDPGQRATVADLIRAASHVHGFSVVVTARLDFDHDARAWLPAAALEDLGEASPLIINELGNDEVGQLKDADPALAALLRPGHPAEKLVRNLYRLKRLARDGDAEDAAPLSEVLMACQWWSAGDSADARGRLERRRVLRALAVHSLTSSAPMDASTIPAEAINMLTESGSLRMPSSVRVEPAHDVLRDWAIGCLLYEEPEHIAEIDLEAPAPVRLVRGVELAARMHAEFGSDASGWQALLSQLSVSGAHGSWRRAVLLSLVRSERSEDILDRCLPALAANNAESLGDLVRAAITVDSQAGAPIWAALGVDTSKLTDDFVVPRGPAWHNLVAWSLATGERLPSAAVPQFVELYNRWCCTFAGQDKFSPRLVARLYAWLVEVEGKNHPRTSRFRAWMAAEEAPGLSMTSAQENDLRASFLMWCKLRPGDAESYLQGVAAHPHRHDMFRKLLRFVGTAPYAAPQAVADLFLEVLPEGDNEEDESRLWMRRAFATWDSEYFPASPARAPFLDLLRANKEQGLRLVHGIVAHAIQQRTHGAEPGGNGIEVPLPGGKRAFPWYQSYIWSRSQESNIVASTLMALEAWAHLQIEDGEPMQAVIDDVLGPDGSPAAYLLVAIDIMLSHWPASRESLWPFAASAMLLATDRQRFSSDILNSNDFPTTEICPEPAGAVQMDSLLSRPSRRMPLDYVLSEYGWNGPADVRESMRQALQEEVQRLGEPGPESSGFVDPGFAAMHALNSLDTANYRSCAVGENGEQTVEYVPPADEAKLLAKLQRKSEEGNAEVIIRSQLMRALSEAHCPADLLEQGVRWATQDAPATHIRPVEDEQEWIERTRFIVATLVLRDGSQELKALQGGWAREQLTEAAKREPNGVGIARQFQYNAAAIAAIGYLAAYRDSSELADLTCLLQLAARRDTGMASVLHAEVSAQRPLPPELTRSLVRLGFLSAIYALLPHDNGFDEVEDYLARQQARETMREEAEQTMLHGAVEAELCWLRGEGPEPDWPELPDPNPPKERYRFTLDKPRLRRKLPSAPSRDFALDAATAANWLSFAVGLWGETDPGRLCALVRHCWPWTAGANGVGCGPDEEPGELSLQWNEAYFTAALAAAVSIEDAGIEEYVLRPLAQLPEERLFDAMEAVLHRLDRLWLADGVVSDNTAVMIREELVQRLIATRSWRRMEADRAVGLEKHLAGAVAAMFMGQHHLGLGPRCYVLPSGIVRGGLILPMLTQLTERAAGSTFVAIAYLSLLEVEPHVDHLVFMSRAVAAWWRSQGTNTEFWIDYGIGPRVCEWIGRAVFDEPVSPTVLDSSDLTVVVDTLVQCGTPLARTLEERLASYRREGAR